MSRRPHNLFAGLQAASCRTEKQISLRAQWQQHDMACKCVQADLAKEREDKASVKEASAKAVTAAKQHAADMSRDLEAVHDELEVSLPLVMHTQ